MTKRSSASGSSQMLAGFVDGVWLELRFDVC